MFSYNAPEVPIRQRLHHAEGPVRGAPRIRAASAADARAFQLAQEITELASRANWHKGRHVTELELASALSVSRTPIRAALKLLQQHGCMETRPNRGFFLLKDGQSLTGFVPVAPVTADEFLQQHIISDHASGRLPASFTIALLAERYGARRATLDKILGRLAAESLVTREAGHQWRFAASLEGEAGVRASYEVRLLLEPQALLLDGTAIELHTVQEQYRRHEHVLAEIRNASRWRRSPSPSSVVALDADFHESVAGFSGNPFVVGVVRQQNALRRLLEFDSYHDVERVTAWVLEHLSILDALAASKPKLASQRLHDHLARAATVAANKFPLLRKPPGRRAIGR